MLSVQNLACCRSGKIIFRDLCCQVGAGGFLSVTGRNGSGKSSLLRLLAGLIAPEAGKILWGASENMPDIHYIGHHDALKPALTLRETLNYWRALRGADKTDALYALEKFALSHLIDEPVRILSAGQRRRLSLTRLVLSPAPLWLLDEPTAALDTTSQQLLFTQIAAHRAQGGTVIAATHDALGIADMQYLDMDSCAVPRA